MIKYITCYQGVWQKIKKMNTIYLTLSVFYLLYHIDLFLDTIVQGRVLISIFGYTNIVTENDFQIIECGICNQTKQIQNLS